MSKTAGNGPMGWPEYLSILSELGLSQSWAGRTFARSEVTGRRWAIATRIPDSVAIILRLMRAGVIHQADVVAAKKGLPGEQATP